MLPLRALLIFEKLTDRHSDLNGMAFGYWEQKQGLVDT
jgi:hypothetical protein